MFASSQRHKLSDVRYHSAYCFASRPLALDHNPMSLRAVIGTLVCHSTPRSMAAAAFFPVLKVYANDVRFLRKVPRQLLHPYRQQFVFFRLNLMSLATLVCQRLSPVLVL